MSDHQYDVATSLVNTSIYNMLSCLVILRNLLLDFLNEFSKVTSALYRCVQGLTVLRTLIGGTCTTANQ